MSYLLTQMFIYLLVAFLLGLLLGYLIWRYGKASAGDLDALRAERDGLVKERDDLRTNLDACRNRSAQDREALESCKADRIDLQNRLDGMTNERDAALVAVPAAAVSAAPAEYTGEASKPEGLSAPRGGAADDLQRINGVGPKLEKLLHDLGYYHFDQIAAWGASEVAWVDQNLEGFKGRVTRDNWVPQAKVLAAE